MPTGSTAGDEAAIVAAALDDIEVAVEYLQLVRTRDGWRIVNALGRYA